MVQTERGYVIFDDTVLDKRYAQQMELVRRQYSGTAKGVINGIGVVTCVYVNPTLDRFWLIDYRIYDPQTDDKSKLDRMIDMVSVWVNHRHLLFSTVLMDSWYATQAVMLHIESLGKHYYCPLKSNRQVDDSNAQLPYRRVDNLQWAETELRHGKRIKIRGFAKHHKVKLFRVASGNGRTDYVVTNDLTQNDTSVAQQVCNQRWKIEQLHREIKQVTGIERCQCRLARIIRNHIGCAMLVWVRLKHVAYQTQKTIYQVKNGLFAQYLRHQLKSPAILMKIA